MNEEKNRTNERTYEKKKWESAATSQIPASPMFTCLFFFFSFRSCIYFLDMAIAISDQRHKRARFHAMRGVFFGFFFVFFFFALRRALICSALTYLLPDMNWIAKYFFFFFSFPFPFRTGEMTSDFFRVVNEARSHSLGPFSPSFNIQTCLLEGLQKFLPPDAHERVNGRLHVSLTRSYDGKNIIVSQFNSREDLLQALLCACFIPGFSGILPPRFQGIRYMDGAFSDNLPVLDENTVTVSPFCGESDICPRDQSAQLFHVSFISIVSTCDYHQSDSMFKFKYN